MSIFTDLPLGGFFTISGEKYKKTGSNTYVSLENPILGEYTLQPFTEKRIVVPGPVKAAKPAPKKTVKKVVAKKVVAKKVVKKSVRRGK